MDDIQSVKELNGDIFLKFAHNICSLHLNSQFFPFGKEGQFFLGAKDGTTLGIRFQRKRDLPYMPCSSATCKPANLLRDWHTKTYDLKIEKKNMCVFVFFFPRLIWDF